MEGSNFIKVLQQANLPVTPARIYALQVLEASYKQNGMPIDAQYFIDKLPADRVTVFRILNAFVEKGIIRKLEFGEGKARYELATKNDHHHLICERCGRVEDIDDMVVPSLEKKISQQTGFLVKRHSLEFFGLCKQCQEGKDKN